MRAQFLADANFDLVILVAAKRGELAFNFSIVRTLVGKMVANGLDQYDHGPYNTPESKSI
jgi:hypothetical protein